MRRNGWLVCCVLLGIHVSGCAGQMPSQQQGWFPVPAEQIAEGLSVAGRWHLGPVYDAVAAGETAYFSLGGALRVLRQDPLTRRWNQAGQIDGYGVLRDLLIDGDVLYAADHAGLLVSFDISNSPTITELDRVRLPAAVMSLSISGTTAVMAAGWQGMVFVDVADPASLRLIGVSKARGYVQDAYADGGVALLANAYKDNGLSLVDVRDPAAPVELGHHALPGIAFGVYRQGERAYIVNLEAYDGEGAGVTIFDISALDRPVQLGAHHVAYGAERVRVRDDIAYLAGVANDAGLIVIDATDPTKPKPLGSYGSPTCSESVELSGSLAFLAHGDEGLEIIDIARPHRPTVVNHHDAAGKARSVQKAGDHLYVANGYGGLRILAPAASGGLREVSRTPTYRAMDVAVSDGFAYLAEDSAGLRVVDVSEPERPQQLARLDTPGEAYGITVVNEIAYVADGGSGLRVLDVSTPRNPTLLGRFDTAGFAHAVRVQDARAYIADGKAGLRIVDVRESGAIKPLGLFRYSNAEVRDVQVVDGIAYLAAGTAGLLAVDVQNPAVPRFVGRFDTPKSARSVAIEDGVAFVGDYSGVIAIDVRDLAAPRELARLQLPGITDKMNAANGLVFVAGYDAGVNVLRFTQSTEVAAAAQR